MSKYMPMSYPWLVPPGPELNAVTQGLAAVPEAPIVLTVPLGATPIPRWLDPILTLDPLPKSLILLGLAGSLQRELTVGTVVVCHDFITPQGDRFSTDPTLAQHVASHLGSGAQVVGYTSDRVITKAQEKQALGQQFEAAIVEMEGAIVAQTLAQYGINLVMVRVISDDCDGNLPNLDGTIAPDGSLKPLTLAQRFSQNPIAALRLIRGSITALRQLQKTSTHLAHLPLEIS